MLYKGLGAGALLFKKYEETMNKHQEKIRDDLGNIQIRGMNAVASVSPFMNFCDGYDAAMEQAKVLEDALESLLGVQKNFKQLHDKEWVDTAAETFIREALAKFRGES